MPEFTVPPLPYAYDALEPYIDTETMHLHHDKHHQAYVNNLNAALKDHADLQTRTLDELLRGIKEVPEAIRIAVVNNGGGHWNHTLFWDLMKPGGAKAPAGPLAEAINGTFGSVENLVKTVSEAATKRFGSGWAWLVKDAEGKLLVYSTANQDCPVMDKHVPLIGLDVWEHAYYLKYRNVRPDYIKAWWNVLNWDEVAKRFAG
jgi:Fe-Mn family superoxide dismutase